eukprot:1048485_1
MQPGIHSAVARKYKYEKIGSQMVRHELNYIDKEKEHPIFMKARQFYLNHDWIAAKREYDNLLSINPKNAMYHHSYACILSRLKTSTKDPTKIILQAQKHSDIATQLDPTSVEIRLTNIEFLTTLQENDQIHEHFVIIFDQLLSLPDYDHQSLSANPRPQINININPVVLASALEFYSHYLHILGEHQQASQYLQGHVHVRKKFNLPISQRAYHDLAHYYLRMENIPKALHHINITKQMGKKSVWEAFQSYRTNDNEPWRLCEAEINLLTENYLDAYTMLKYDLDAVKRDHAELSMLIIYTDLMKCCIELSKFTEADALDDELHDMCRRNVSILDLSTNRNIGWEREFMLAYSWIKQGGKTNAMKAVKQMRNTTRCVMNLNAKHMGNRIPSAHFYLGLAYKNLSKYVDKRYYRSKAKEALHQAAHLYNTQAVFVWEFAVILLEENELYLCIKYAREAWTRCKEVRCVANGFPKMKKKWKKQRKGLKCSYCGQHKYLKSRKNSDKLKVCKGCHSCYYCDLTCQKRHWKQEHHKHCAKIWIKWKKQLLPTIDGFSRFVPFSQLTSEYCLLNALV